MELVEQLSSHDPLFSAKEAGEYLGMRPSILQQWRHRNIGPPYVRLGKGMIRYRRSMLNAFALMREHQTERLPALSRGRFPIPGRPDMPAG